MHCTLYYYTVVLVQINVNQWTEPEHIFPEVEKPSTQPETSKNTERPEVLTMSLPEIIFLPKDWNMTNIRPTF